MDIKQNKESLLTIVLVIDIHHDKESLQATVIVVIQTNEHKESFCSLLSL